MGGLVCGPVDAFGHPQCDGAVGNQNAVSNRHLTAHRTVPLDVINRSQPIAYDRAVHFEERDRQKPETDSKHVLVVPVLPNFISPHLISPHLISSHLTSSHLISPHLTCHLILHAWTYA